MKKYMTKNALGFGLTSVLLAILFFYSLFSSLNRQEYDGLLFRGIVFAASMFASGFLWGYFDRVRNTRHDIGFLYHFITFLVTNTVYLLGALVIYQGGDWVLGFTMQVVFWGLGLLVHYYFSRRSIKGMSPDELFE